MQAVIYRGISRAATYAKDVGRLAGIPTVRRLPSKWIPRHREEHVVVNWGCSAPPTERWPDTVGRLFNNFDSVKNSVDKHSFFLRCSRWGVQVPKFYQNEDAAREELQSGRTVIARTLTRSSGGAGIVVLRPGDEVVPARLYTNYFNGAAEYRVHVFRGAPPLVAQKRRRAGSRPEGRDLMIRNWGTGWVFCVNNVTAPPEGMLLDCQRALDALGLDFAAIDCRAKRDGAWVLLEANTAPGIEGTVVQYYAENVKRLINNE